MKLVKVFSALALLAAAVFLFLGLQSPATTLKSPPQPSPSTRLQDLPAYAPTSTPPLTSLTLSAFAPCAPIAPCSLTLNATFSPVYRGTLTYTFILFDRCTATSVSLPTRSLAVPAFTTLTLTVPVGLPPLTHPTYLFALASAPVRVASNTLSLGPPSCP